MTGAVLAVETGGTKIVGRLAWGDGGVEARWPTGTPDEALHVLVEFVERELPHDVPLTAAGIAAFGPIRLDPIGGQAGRVFDTPKPGWTGSNLRMALADRLGVAVGIDTDVNAAALAELAFGAGRGADSVAYVKVGTGIGAGLAGSAGILQGALHPEVGHLRLVRQSDDDLPSVCPFRADCAEGLASGPALARRLSDGNLDGSAALATCARYVAQLLVGIVLAWSPPRIILGGGLQTVRTAFDESLGGYGVGEAAKADDFIVPPRLPDAGLEGALIIARQIISNAGRPANA